METVETLSLKTTVFEDRQSLLEFIATIQGNCYALYDSCDEPCLQGNLPSNWRRTSLFTGRAAGDYSAIAPHLIDCTPEVFECLVEIGCISDWGFFFYSRESLLQCKKHWKQFLFANHPTEGKVNFRFYDPRILDGFLQTLDRQESERFFGPVDSILIPCDKNKFKCVSLPENPYNKSLSTELLQIREKHLSIFSDSLLNDFRKETVLHLRDKFPENVKVSSVEGTRKIVDLAITITSLYGIDILQDISRVAELIVIFDENFGTKAGPPWAFEILQSNLLEPNDKVDLLVASFLSSRQT